MKQFTLKKTSFLILISIFFQSIVFSQTDKTPEPIKYGDKPIYIHSSLGPFGEIYLPPSVIANATNYSLSGREKISFEADNYFFPSIYFTVSAKPNIDIRAKRVRNNKDKEEDKKNPDYEFTKKGENLNWLRVTTEIQATPCECEGVEGCLKSEEIKIIGLSPEETKTRVKENPLSQIGVVGDALVNKLLPFTFAEEHPETQNASAEYSAVSGAVSILFQNLFPAKSIAKNYAFIDGEVNKKNRFGWYWQRIDDKDSPESIIGVRRGTVFLQIARGVQAIKVNHYIYAKWDSDYSEKIDDEYVDQIEMNKEFKFDESNCFKPAKPKSLYERTNFQMLNNVDEFPVLIPKEIVCKMFQQDVGDPKFRVEDIIDADKLLKHYTDSNVGPISSKIWSLINSKVLKRLEIKNPTDPARKNIKSLIDVFNARPGQENKEPKQKLENNESKSLSIKAKIVIADEMNRIFDDEEFFDFMSLKVGDNAAGQKILDELKSQGKTKEIQIAMREKIETEIASDKLKKYYKPSQCDSWFATNPFTSVINGANGDKYVKREEVKSKLDLPTLKELINKAQIEMVQKP